MAEAHPVGFRWVMKAKERGATIIHVDPRFSRTSTLADIWVPIRAGSDIVFLGGLIRHVIEHDLFFRDYVVHYTNASCILRDEYADPEDNADGYFSGWNEDKRAYDRQSWLYKGEGLSHPERDPTLQDRQCVFQKLKRHFSRYTPELVEKVCGIPPELFHKVADALVAASGPEKTAALCYAVGWTQHSKGVQIIRTASILQLLLGNIGRPGGGILALRGHASIQGSTDIPTLYDILPGYLAMPRGGKDYANGLDPQDFDLIVVKSPHTEFHMYDQWVAKNFNIDVAGATSANLRSLGHTICARPVYPLDDDVGFTPRATIYRS